MEAAIPQGPSAAGVAAALVVNVRARRGEDALAAAREALAGLGVRLVEVHALTEPATIGAWVDGALHRGARLFVVGGGDGTVSAVADRLVASGTGASLAVLPLGTGNDFARSLGIPFDLSAACAVAAGGVEAPVDVGRAAGRHFLNAASVGVSGALTRRLRPELKRRVGRLAYPLLAAGEALRFEPFRLRLRHEGGALELDALQVVVGNGRFHGGGRLIAPEAALDEGRLDVYAIRVAPEGARATELLRLGARLRAGTHVDDPSVEHVVTRWVELEADPPQELDLDGELAGETPARLEVVPAALRVRLPRAPSRRS